MTVVVTLLLMLATTIHAQTITTRTASRAPAAFLVAEANDATWLVVPTARATPQEPPGWTVLRRGSVSADAFWLPINSLSQRPVSIAAYGDRLAILNADGQWAVISSDAQAVGPSLPSGLKPIALVASETNLLFLCETTPQPGPQTLITFDGASFINARPLPEATDNDSTKETRLGANLKGVATLTRFRESDADLIATGDQSASPRHLINIDDIALSADAEILATRSGQKTYLAAVDSGAQTRGVEISLPSQAAAGPLTLSHEAARNAAKFWWLDGGVIFFQPFDLSGKPLSDPIAVAEMPVPTPPLFERVLYVVGAATLLLVLLAGGRQTLAASRALAAKQPPSPAPLARRLAAGLVDCVPLGAVAGYLIAGGKLTIFAGMLRFDSVRSEAILAAGVALYLVLLISFELRWQRSVGKAIFALRVISVDGRPPTARAVLIRNALRLIDLNLITLLIVPLSPLRQRLGDFLAGTMVIDVVQQKTSPPPRALPDDRADKS